uniref:PAZ domain-containing protein n=1 Tax=Ascaris lumbricoides TaxID=6252 RepID=A0A0M3I3T3_ASCLU
MLSNVFDKMRKLQIDEKYTLMLPQERSYRQFVVNRPYEGRFDLYKRFDLPTAHLYYPYGYEELMNIAE